MDREMIHENVTHELGKLWFPDILGKLHANNVSIKRLILGGSHSVVTYPPLWALLPWAPSVDAINYGSSTNLYIHIAFCETECSFCHYAVKFYRGKERSSEGHIKKVFDYLDALKKEIIMRSEKLAQSGTTISSIYIWGGTPLILEKEELGEIIDLLYEKFTIQPNIDFCIEGSPLSITAKDGLEKLEYLKEKWINRLSFWIQSFHDEVLKYSARGYKKETALKACDIVGKVFSNWNIDLIQWLYKGSPDEVWDNLEYISQLQPPHITWYHGRFVERPQKEWLLGKWQNDFESEEETLYGRMMIWEYLNSLGYTQVDGNRFVRHTDYIDPFKKSRTSVSNDLLGIGLSSYSHINNFDAASNGLFFRNIAKIEDYIVRINESWSAIGTHRIIDAEEKLAASYVVGLRTYRQSTPELTALEMNLPKLAHHYHTIVVKLTELWLIENKDKARELSTLWKLFEDEILSAFYSPSVFKYLEETGNSF